MHYLLALVIVVSGNVHIHTNWHTHTFRATIGEYWFDMNTQGATDVSQYCDDGDNCPFRLTVETDGTHITSIKSAQAL